VVKKLPGGLLHIRGTLIFLDNIQTQHLVYADICDIQDNKMDFNVKKPKKNEKFDDFIGFFAKYMIRYKEVIVKKIRKCFYRPNLKIKKLFYRW